MGLLRRGKGKFLHYIDEDRGIHMHLRIDPDGRGVLVVNASHVIYLNRSAAFYVECMMKGLSSDQVVKLAKRRFKKVNPETIRRDYEDVVNKVYSFVLSQVCPLSSLGFTRVDPLSLKPSAPYRMDLALTYRCNNRCIHCYSSSPEAALSKRELPKDKWIRIIDKLYRIGVPYIVFTGGEPTLRDDLVDLIAYAQKKGLVTGLVTNGRRLADKDYLHSLIEAGLDSIQITLESADPEVHDKITGVKGSWEETVQGIKNALNEKVYLDVNMTLMTINIDGVEEWVKFLHKLGVKNISINKVIYSGKALEKVREFEPPLEKTREALVKVKELAHELGMKFTWYGVTRYCELNPLELGLGLKTCSAALMAMCIEPDGSVLPCQSYFKPVGNILKDKWEKIWNHPLCITIRERKYAPEKCRRCPQFRECGGGCPLEIGYWR